MALDGGWTVREMQPRPADATGGHFSVGYIAEDEQGGTAFLKALDFSAPLEEPDLTAAMQLMTTEYTFERDVCRKCRDARLSRVALALSEGTVTVPNAGPLSRVPYLLFEYADRNARSHLDRHGQLEVVWRLRTLHQP